MKASQAFTPSSAEEGSFPPRLFPNNAQSKNSVSLELNRGFTSNGRANTATIFDLKTLKILGQVKTGTNPDAILYDPSSQRVFAFNCRRKDVTVFDAATGVVASMIALGGKPEFAIADSKGRVYVNIEDTSEVAEIDSRRLTVTKRSSLKPCEEPSGIILWGTD